MKRPKRSCIGCRKVEAREDLIRLALRDGRVVIDRDCKRPGRGAYVHCNVRCMKSALEPGKLRRAFRSNVAPEGAEDLWKELIGQGCQKGG